MLRICSQTTAFDLIHYKTLLLRAFGERPRYISQHYMLTGAANFDKHFLSNSLSKLCYIFTKTA